METRKMNIKLHDTDGHAHDFQIEGDKSLPELQEMVRTRLKVTVWDRIVIQRQDGKPFWIEEKRNYASALRYDSDFDTRLEIDVRLDIVDRTYITKKLRTEPDPKELCTKLCEVFKFQLPKIGKWRFIPEPPWIGGQDIHIKVLVSPSYESSTDPYHVERTLLAYLSADPRVVDDLPLPSQWNKHQI
jgi:hypothetical protein